ncbi:uncharacterized protein C8A04DRAFT_32221 [Dichotomopilus funicola]|uniref:HNH nuclease domain-containing protein n=1 Tax=Dichotomopilus funicola TaxID=1934379 RepID=A0AAN6UW82_9PEZI|nr:hypothetical protein C8A04DRAFT_32221 [Dichotomopilus funicola]
MFPSHRQQEQSPATGPSAPVARATRPVEYWRQAAEVSIEKISKFTDLLHDAREQLQQQWNNPQRDPRFGQEYLYGLAEMEMETELDAKTQMAWWSTPDARCLVERVVAAEAETRVYESVVREIARDRDEGGMDGIEPRVVEPDTAMCSDLYNTLDKVHQKEVMGGNGTLLGALGGAEDWLGTGLCRLMISTKIASTTRRRVCGSRTILSSRFVSSHTDSRPLSPRPSSASHASASADYDTPANGLLLHHAVAHAVADGALAVVPALGDERHEASIDDIDEWEISEPKEYRWRVVDPSATSLDAELDASACCDPRCGGDSIISTHKTTICDLDGERLVFDTNEGRQHHQTRPAVRYLYFHYLVCHLRLAWRHGYHDNARLEDRPAESVLGLKNWQPFWPIQQPQDRGVQCLAPTCLLALEEEFIHCVTTEDDSPRTSYLSGHQPDEADADKMDVEQEPTARWSYPIVPLVDSRGSKAIDRAGLVAMAKIVQARRTLEEVEGMEDPGGGKAGEGERRRGGDGRGV